MPTITVIIAAYQAAGTLGAALASIAAQSRPADQVVVVDDGSADGTAEVAEAWAPLLPVRVIRKAVNEGVGLARRDAVAASTGDLVAMIDADDYWLPDHLAVCLASFEEHGGIVSAKGVRWVPGQVLGTTPWDALSPVPRPEDQRREILRRNFLLSAVLFSRDAYDEAGGFVDLRCDEDWDLWIKMIRLGHLVTVPATVTVLSRNRPESLSSEESYLPYDVELLTALAESVEPAERRVVTRALDRRLARVDLIAGYEHARQGRTGAARRLWARAALRDRSVRGGLTPQGSVALRALLCMAAPRAVVGRRDRRSHREARHG